MLARIKAMQRLGAQRVHAAFLARKAELEAQWLAVRIARGRNFLAAHRSAPAALRTVLNRNVSSLVALRQTVVSTHQPIAGSFYAGISRALFHGGTGTFHGVPSPPAVPTAPPPPTISGATPTGQPGDEVSISGSGFGLGTGLVLFLLGPNAVGPAGQGAIQSATVGYWSDTQIIAYVPNVSGITAYSGSLYVRAASGKSNVVTFQFQPALDVQQLPVGTGNVQWGGSECGWSGQEIQETLGVNPFVSYCAGVISGTHGDDWFFKANTPLANGWTLDSVNFATPCPVSSPTPVIGGGNNGAWLMSSGQGTGTPYVHVFWNDSPPNGLACYSFSLTITGPLGTPW
jgi:hypothetical protein